MFWGLNFLDGLMVITTMTIKLNVGFVMPKFFLLVILLKSDGFSFGLKLLDKSGSNFMLLN